MITTNRIQTSAPKIDLQRTWSWRLLLGLLLAAGLTTGVWFGLPQLSEQARLAFIVFGLAVLAWIFTDINDTYVALVAASSFALVGIDEPEEFFATLGDPMIWLLLASFIIAAAVNSSGLSRRLALTVAGKARSVSQLFYALTAAIMLTAFIIPATSGRAALLVPIFVALSSSLDDRRVNRALALLFPTVILLSAVASLLGAGAHLVTAEILARMGGERIGFGYWLVLGLPFALVSCFGSTWVILHLFLNRDERRRPLQLTSAQLAGASEKDSPTLTPSLNRKEWYVLGVVLVLMLLWATEALHGFNGTIIAILGALAVTLPNPRIITFKDGLKAVNWDMLLFMAATLELGEGLTESGGAEWLVKNMFSSFQDGSAGSAIWVVSAVAVVSLLSHLLITSRTARSSVLIPLVVLLAVSLGYNPITLAFLSTAAAGFCLTLPVSAKPVAMFGRLEGATFEPRDLLRLSSVLLPFHFGLLLTFAFFVWPWLGLELTHQIPTAPPQAPTWQDPSLNDYISRRPTPVKPKPTAQPAASPTPKIVDVLKPSATLPVLAAAREATATVLPSPTPSPISSPTPLPARQTANKIVYVQSSGQGHALGLVTAGGDLLNGSLHLYAAAPTWSPDGTTLAFFGEPAINQLGGLFQQGSGVWLIDASGGSPRLLVAQDHIKNIIWSPDGSKLAFEIGPPDTAHEIMVVDARDGRSISRFFGEQPAWVSDSQKLAIKACLPGCGLWQVNIAGGEGKQLTFHSNDSFPVWSPTGQYLAFTSDQGGGNWDIYRLRLADGNLQPLTSRSGSDITPVFSRDGQEIYFRTDAFGGWRINAIGVDGNGERLVKEGVGHSDDWGLARPAVY
ncbi:MAG: anion permease [Anaerolineae bacterium]|nr:anion permease [Anaerolineae bacterium]